MVCPLGARGGRLTAGDLAKVFQPQHSFADLGGLLHEAVDVRLLDVDDLYDTYWFPLQAEVLERQLPGDQRRGWHETFAAYVEQWLDGWE